jgi:hypothetical protein
MVINGLIKNEGGLSKHRYQEFSCEKCGVSYPVICDRCPTGLQHKISEKSVKCDQCNVLMRVTDAR